MPPTRTALRLVLKSQYHAALAILGEAIERCPDDVWSDARLCECVLPEQRSAARAGTPNSALSNSVIPTTFRRTEEENPCISHTNQSTSFLMLAAADNLLVVAHVH